MEGTTLGKARIAKSELDKWGVAWEVLGRDDVFGVWVEGERKCEYPLRPQQDGVH